MTDEDIPQTDKVPTVPIAQLRFHATSIMLEDETRRVIEHTNEVEYSGVVYQIGERILFTYSAKKLAIP
jgi:hypothetical protein